jgi:hypothetical protein
MKRLAALLLGFALRPAAADMTAADLAARIREAGLDPDECFAVRDLNFTKEDLRFRLTEGYLIFGQPVEGRHYSAVFVEAEEAGDAEVLAFPPSRSERMSLARATETPNFNEHFKMAVMLFTDDTYDAIMREIRRVGGPRPAEERGRELAGAWDQVVRNLVSSFETRLIRDSLSGAPASGGFFYTAIESKRLGNLDLIYDPERSEQIIIGRVGYHGEVPYFDTWTSFAARSFRNGSRSLAPAEYQVSDYRLDAALDNNLLLTVTTRLILTPLVDGVRIVSFNLSPRMRLSAVSVDGVQAEFFQRETVRESLLRGGDSAILLVAPAALERGRRYQLEFHHAGSVIQAAGNNVFFVGSRDNWYPTLPAQFATYEVVFRYPSGLDLVVAGESFGDTVEGDLSVVRRRVTTPVQFLGFNLGDYERESLNRGRYRIDVYANKLAEPGLQPRPDLVVTLAPPGWDPLARRGASAPVVSQAPTARSAAANPAARLKELASEVGAVLDFMTESFGPAPLRTLTVSPIPGFFGQGFPGMVYLSTVSYLSPELRPKVARGSSEDRFYSQLLLVHEVAHQWWGNVVASARDHDAWLMEALASYSALLFLERREGPQVVDEVLGEYRKRLLSEAAEGRIVDSIGPIIWGSRLSSSLAPDAWRVITYEKGAWVMHMLRRRLGDHRFLAMLVELLKRYRQSSLTTEQFRALAAEFMPSGSPDSKLEVFFENWVYTTGIPTLKISHTTQGAGSSLKLIITVRQSGVDGDFSTYVPVEIQTRGAKPMTQWIRTDSEPVTVTIPVRQAPLGVVLDPAGSVLAVK